MSSGSPWGAIVALVVVFAVAHQCSEDKRAKDDAIALEQQNLTAAADAAASTAANAAAAAMAGTTYADQGRPYGCTDDCSGHDAGYEWAEEREITDPDDCGGNSQSFIEGCEAYAEAYQEEHSEASEDEGW